MAGLKVKYVRISRTCNCYTCVKQHQSCVKAHTHHANKPAFTTNVSCAQRTDTFRLFCSFVYAIQVFGGDKAKLRKTDNLKNEVAGLEAAVQAAGQEYDRVKLRNTQVSLHTNLCMCMCMCMCKTTPSSSLLPAFF